MFAVVVLPAFQLANDAIDKRLATADPKLGICRFVDYPPSRGKLGFPRCLFEKPLELNTNFWLRGVDFSCVSPWNDSTGAFRAGTAISKRHIVFANHFPLWKGVRISFVGEDGEVCPCHVEATKRVGDTDIAVGLLNAELTPNIRPAKILPMDFEATLGNGNGFPVITFNQQEKAFLTELDAIPTNRFISYGRQRTRNGEWRPMPKTVWNVRSSVSTNAVRAAFRELIVGGDSGNPAFLLLGDEPIILCCLRGGGCGCGPALHLYRREIQAAMDELCPGYKLEAFKFGK